MLLSMCMLVTGCANDLEYSGNVVDLEKDLGLHVGDSMDVVWDKLGTPSYKSSYGDTKFIYLQKKLIYRPILGPKVDSFDTIVITFNEDLQVSNIQKMADMELQEIEKYSRKIELQDNKLNPVQQILGNIGKYNSAPKKVI